MKTFDYLKIVATKLAREKDNKKLADFKIKLDVFLMKDRITAEEYNKLLEILEAQTTNAITEAK